MDWKAVVIPITVSVAAIIVTAVVNIRIKFAATREEATTDLKHLASNAMDWLLIALVFAALAVEVSSHEPLTRTSVFSIALEVAAIFFFATMKLIRLMFKGVSLLIDAHKSHLELTGKIVDFTGEVVRVAARAVGSDAEPPPHKAAKDQ